ncbi:hypothetical protein NSERUTF1_1666 [Nocardia seriolae]|nr:hypothetical protein NSERUTF1_1666 [Nocardia seriolae]
MAVAIVTAAINGGMAAADFARADSVLASTGRGVLRLRR